jgi:hypothetical protein
LLKKLLEAGLSIIPITKGAKYPCIKWDVYQERLATAEEAANWTPPIGIVGGRVSGGLICIDFDDRGSRFIDWMNLVQSMNAELALSLVIQNTPSGGFHAVYRCPDVTMGNEKLARMAQPKDGKLELIETRGEGGQFLACPSEGYRLIQNDFFKIPTLCIADHELLISCARSFNERNDAPEQEKTPPPAECELSPFDAFDKANSPLELLTTHGWTVEFTRGEVTYLKRPDKKERGISASWNHIPGRFFVFTTNTGFENEHVYKASAVYALLEHAGDFKAAARALLDKGFGTRRAAAPKPAPVKEQDAPVSAAAPQVLKVFRVHDFRDSVVKLRKEGLPVGYSTGFRSLDPLYKIARGQLNIVTGIPSSGKSEVMDAIMVNVARDHGWKFVVFSPENYPLEFHFKKLAEKYINRYFAQFTESELDCAIKFIQAHFIFIPATEDNVSIDNIIETVESIKATEQVDGLLIDPWNEVDVDIEDNSNETLYIGKSLSRIRKFSRKHNLATWIVAHPTKLRKEKTPEGKWEYPIPDLYSISGSANWYNKADNGIVIWRDFLNGFTKIIIQKIKFKYYGRLGEVKLFYQNDSGNYSEEDRGGLTNF